MENTQIVEKFERLKSKVDEVSSRKKSLESRISTLKEQQAEIFTRLQKDYSVPDLPSLRKAVSLLAGDLEKRIGEAEEAFAKLSE